MAQVRLTKKGIIALLVVLCLFAFGLGYGLWKVTGAPNLAPTDSDAAGGCKGKDKKSCNGCGNSKTNGKGESHSYACKWKGGGCSETSQKCDSGGSSGNTACNNVAVGKGKKECNPGSETCQHDSKGKNTGYNCTCLNISSATVCETVWRCTEYNKQKCKAEGNPPIVGSCGKVNGSAVEFDETRTFNVYTCKGQSYEDGKTNGCNSGTPTVVTGKSVSPKVGGNFCGWVQADDVNDSGCIRSWYFPCNKADNPPEDSNICEGGGVITPTSKVTSNVGSTVVFKGYAYDADGVNSKITVSSNGQALGNATVVDACGTGGDTTICNQYKNKKPVIWTYNHTVTSGNETLTATWKDSKGVGGANCDASASLSGTVVQDNWSLNKSAGRVCIDENTENPKVELTYVITLKNMATENKTITKVVDTLDAKVQGSYIQLQSIQPAGATVEGNVITWNLTGDTALFEPDEVLLLKYTIIVPRGAFGLYKNNVEVFPLNSENTIEASEEILASCDVPDTAIFDSTTSKIAVGVFVFAVGLAYLYLDPFETGVSKMFGKIAYALSANGRIDKNRKKFEKRVVR